MISSIKKKVLNWLDEMTKLSFNLANKPAILFLIGNTHSPNKREGPIIKSKTQYWSLIYENDERNSCDPKRGYSWWNY